MYRAPDPSALEEFRQPGPGASIVAWAWIFIAIPTVGLGHEAWVSWGPLGTLVPITLAVLFALAIYAFFSEDTRVVIDAQTLRVSHRTATFFYRGPEKIEWEIPLAALTKAREVKVHTPSKNGGWSHSTKLQFPNGRTLESGVLGGENEGTPYRALVASLKARLGDAFVSEDDFGPLTAAMNAAKKTSQKDET